MANLFELYSYDEAIENAWRDILTDAFFEAGVTAKAFIEQSDDVKDTPFIDIQLRDSIGLKQRKLIPPNLGMYNSWEAHLVSRVTTMRGKNSNLQSTLIGIIRAEAASFADVFNQANLPSHTVLDMRDAGLHRGVVKDPPLDWSEVFHRIVFSIRDQAW
jgi:hypothetical protein